MVAPTGYWYRVDHTGTTALGTRTPTIIGQQHVRRSRIETALQRHVRGPRRLMEWLR